MVKVKERTGGKPKIERMELLKYLEENPDATYEEIGENFRTTKSTAHRGCVRYGITHKKTPKYKERDEEKEKNIKMK